MKLVYESLNEFGKGKDPLSTLNIGREGSIRKFFRDLDVPDEDYNITENAVIFGNLNLSNTDITEFPDENYIIDDLILEDCADLIKLPNDLQVSGWICLTGCIKLTEIPEELKVHTDLNLDECINLTKLPENLTVGGWLDIRNCQALTELPKGLKIKKTLVLKWTNITELPEDLIVEGLIIIDPFQYQLKKWLVQSKFGNKVEIRE